MGDGTWNIIRRIRELSMMIKSLLHCRGEGGTAQSGVTDEARQPCVINCTDLFKLFINRPAETKSYISKLYLNTEGEGLIRLGLFNRIVSLSISHAKPPSPKRWRRLYDCSADEGFNSGCSRNSIFFNSPFLMRYYFIEKINAFFPRFSITPHQYAETVEILIIVWYNKGKHC